MHRDSYVLHASDSGGSMAPGVGRRRCSRRPQRVGRGPLALLVALVLLAGCDESFDPIGESDYRFSVWGFLNTAADTQWVRVMPIRRLARPSGKPLEAAVTLEHLGTGERIPLRDSLFSFLVNGGPVQVHNFWTAAPLEPEATYRLTVDQAGGPPAEADVLMPPDFRAELWVGQEPGAGNFLRLIDLKHVAFFEQRLAVTTGCRSDSFEWTVEVDSAGTDGEDIMIRLASTPAPEGCKPVTARGAMWVAGSGAVWPDELEFAPGALGEALEGPSNVSNALGFVGGIMTRTFPYQVCGLVDPGGEGVPSHCRLRYDDDVATLFGTIRETRCGAGRMTGAVVTVTELEGEPAGARRILYARSSFGEYEVLLLEPGIRTEVRVVAARVSLGEGPVQNHTIHMDTVQLAPGERRRYDVNLEQLSPC